MLPSASCALTLLANSGSFPKLKPRAWRGHFPDDAVCACATNAAAASSAAAARNEPGARSSKDSSSSASGKPPTETTSTLDAFDSRGKCLFASACAAAAAASSAAGSGSHRPQNGPRASSSSLFLTGSACIIGHPIPMGTISDSPLDLVGDALPKRGHALASPKDALDSRGDALPLSPVTTSA